LYAEYRLLRSLLHCCSDLHIYISPSASCVYVIYDSDSARLTFGMVNNIDATGAGADVDMKIRAAMQQTSQQTILSIQDLMRRRRFG